MNPRAHRLQRGVRRPPGPRAPVSACHRGGLLGLRAPRGTEAFNVEFVMQAACCIDWHALRPWMDAIDRQLGIPLPAAVYKLHTLATWFGLDPGALAHACRRPEFRRFVGAPPHGRTVESDLYLEYAGVLGQARIALTRLDAAVELQLIDHGFLAPSAVLRGLHPAPTEPVAWPPRATRREAASAWTAARAPGIGQPVLVWPWGESTTLMSPLHVGRDPSFSDRAAQFAPDLRISRRHALLVPDPAGVVIEDLGAANGTYVDEELVPPGTSRRLVAGARLRFGPDFAVVLRFVP
jgi:hypothetical protein